MNYRIEKDTMGEVQVPADKYWGAQTERSRNNVKISSHTLLIKSHLSFANTPKSQLA